MGDTLGSVKQGSATFEATNDGVVTSVSPGPTRMSRLLLWVIVVVVTLAVIVVSIVAAILAAGASASLEAGQEVKIGSTATFVPAEGWEPSQPEADMPTGAVAYSKDGVSIYLWTASGSGATGLAAAQGVARKQFPTQFAAGNYFNLTQVSNTQLRMGIADQPALTFGYVNFNGNQTVAGFSKGVPTESDDFTLLFGDISSMWASVGFRSGP